MMMIKQGAGLRAFLLMLCIGLSCHTQSLYGVTYYLYRADLAASFIEIPTSNVSGQSPIISSSYLVGEAPIYNVHNINVGTYSGYFLSMQTQSGIRTNIANFLSADIKDRQILEWSTPATPINLELDTIIKSIATQYKVETATKIGSAHFLGKTFRIRISSDSEKSYDAPAMRVA